MGTLIRVTENSMATRTVDNLQLAMQKLQDIQDKQSSGKRIRKPSDDPTGAVQAMQYRADQKRHDQYIRNADDAMGWLGTADTALTQSLRDIQRVRDLLLQGANGTSDPASRSALAQEINTTKDNLVGLANATYNNRPIFAGTADPAGQSPAVDTYTTTGTFNGNTSPVWRTIGPNASIVVSLDGPSVFGTPGSSDLWTVLDEIQAHMNSSDQVEQNKLAASWVNGGGTTVKSDLDRLDDLRLNIQNRLSEIGARYHRVETMQTRAKDTNVTLQTNQSLVENIDLAKTIMDMQLQTVAYQAALGATARVIPPSLADFLK